MNTIQKVALVGSVIGEYSLYADLTLLELTKSIWYYRQRHKVDDGEESSHLQPIFERVACEQQEYNSRCATTELHE